jgi:hypothetical protein
VSELAVRNDIRDDAIGGIGKNDEWGRGRNGGHRWCNRGFGYINGSRGRGAGGQKDGKQAEAWKEAVHFIQV